MTNIETMLIKFKSMNWARKASIFIFAAEKASVNLDGNKETLQVCGAALEKCWIWLSHEDIRPEELAFYLDADEDENPHMNEFLFGEGSVEKESLIFVTMVIGFVANKAYLSVGRDKDMSEIICEANEHILPDLINYGLKLDVFDEHFSMR